jgi:phage-related protein
VVIWVSEAAKERSKISILKSTIRGTFKDESHKRIPANFYRTDAGNEPVRLWLKSMAAEDRRLIGEDIKKVEFGWPLGMPTCRPMGDGLHEVRTALSGNRIARVFFYVDRNQRMILLHGILKKTKATPTTDLELARTNKRKHERGLE